MAVAMVITSISCSSFDLFEVDRTIRPDVVGQSSVRTVSNVQYDHRQWVESREGMGKPKTLRDGCEYFQRPAWDLIEGHQSCRYIWLTLIHLSSHR